MGVKKPQYHLRSKWSLPSFHKSKGKLSVEAELNLVSMIDIFSCIILFLMMTFSAEGQILFVSPGLTLPQASHAFSVKRAPVVTVRKEGVTIEGTRVGDNSGIETKVEDLDWALPMLKAELRAYKEFFKQADPGIPFPAQVVMQADKELEFLYIKRAMYTLVEEGYVNIDLVTSGEGLKARRENTEQPQGDAGAR